MSPLKGNDTTKALWIPLSQSDSNETDDSEFLDIDRVSATAAAITMDTTVLPPLNHTPSNQARNEESNSVTSNDGESEGDFRIAGRPWITYLMPADIANLRERSITIETSAGPVFFMPRQRAMRSSEGINLATASMSELSQEHLSLKLENAKLRQKMLSLHQLLRGKAGAVSKLQRF